MKKGKNKLFVWLYMCVLCCVIAVGVALCISMSGAGLSDLSTQKADLESVFETTTLEDEAVPLTDSVSK